MCVRIVLTGVNVGDKGTYVTMKIIFFLLKRSVQLVKEVMRPMKSLVRWSEMKTEI